MKKTCLVASGAFVLFALAGVSALWSERIGESILGVSNPVWQLLVRAYGADTVDQKLDLVFGVLLIAGMAAIGGLIAYGYRRWLRSKGSDFEFYALLLAFNSAAILLLANALWWFGYAWHFIDASHPSWTWLKETCGVDRAYRMLDWAFPATSAIMLVVTAGIARCAIVRHRRPLA
jgi:hypothetical protein